MNIWINGQWSSNKLVVNKDTYYQTAHLYYNINIANGRKSNYDNQDDKKTGTTG